MAMALNETRCILNIYTKGIPTKTLLISEENYKLKKNEILSNGKPEVSFIFQKALILHWLKLVQI